MYFYGLRMRRHEPSDAAAFGYSAGRERWGDGKRKRSQKRDAMCVPRWGWWRSSKEAAFIFIFAFNTALQVVFSVHWGQQQNARKRTRKHGVPYCGRSRTGRQTQRRGFIATTRAVAQDEEREGHGGGQQAATGRNMAACLATGVVAWGGWRPHCIIVYGSMR